LPYERGATWRKSSYSNSQGGDCVEVASTGMAVLVRDSKAPDSGRLALSAHEWDAFLTGVRNGEFDVR
jgi:hypothetical protein